MRVFMTGATGFIGSYLVPELIAAGHTVVGLVRSEQAAEKVTKVGAEAFYGDLSDLERLRVGAGGADAVIHAGFNHDFAAIRQHSEQDRLVVEAIGEALTGSDRPFIVTSGTGLVERSSDNAAITETDKPASSAKVPRAATEEAADAVAAKGVRVMVVRLPQVHDTNHQGRIAHHIRLARDRGWVAYIGDGTNRLAAGHVLDVVLLYRIVLERGEAGARYHAVGEEGVSMRDIAEVIGEGLSLPVGSISRAVAKDYFGVVADLAGLDMAASSALTQQVLDWAPIGPDLLADMRQMAWVAG